MLWPFNHFRKPRYAPARTIEAIYGMIVTQAREPLFYRDLGVPDTVNGRFDLLLLQMWIVLRHLRGIEGGAEITQAVFDRFCADMDANLREMAVGDLTVPKKMRSLGEAFYGRVAAYDRGLGEGADALATAIDRNILDGGDTANARRLAIYAQAAVASLEGEGDIGHLVSAWKFPQPMVEGA
jgi:cytochrome b pre-mRNA-processing protein 3